MPNGDTLIDTNPAAQEYQTATQASKILKDKK